MKQTVKIVRCTDYHFNEVYKAVKNVFSSFGGVKKVFKGKKRIAVKVNLLKKAEPSEAITTHPQVAFCICKILQENGLKPFIVDSPGTGTPFTKEGLQKVYEKCGYFELFKKNNIKLNYNTNFKEVILPSHNKTRAMQIINAILNADAVVSVGKGKTHAFTQLTAAVKNLFGIVPDMYKAAYHARLKNIQNFSEMLVDIYEFIQPVFSIIDAVEVMEGNGPAAGDVRHLGYILGSPSGLAADYAFSQIIGLKLDYNPVLQAAAKRKLIDIKKVKIKGDFQKVNDFKLADTAASTPDGHVNPSLSFRIFYEILKWISDIKPYSNKNCTACRICEKSCPVQAIKMKNKRAVFDYSKCIRCYCCHEMCNNKAIDLKKSLFGKLFQNFIKNRVRPPISN